MLARDIGMMVFGALKIREMIYRKRKEGTIINTLGNMYALLLYLLTKVPEMIACSAKGTNYYKYNLAVFLFSLDAI